MVKSLSVFFPAYNEEGNIRSVVEKTLTVLNKYKFPWEILIINDGSTDRTGEIANILSKKNNHIRVFHQTNGGYGKALVSGFTNCRYEWIVYTDADGQFDFSQIMKFFSACDHADAIWGYRINRRDPVSRHVFGFVWRLTAGLFFKIIPRDVNCGFKMIKKSAITEIFPLQSTRGAMINVELAYKFNKAGYTIKEVGVNHYHRGSGHPTGASPMVAIKSFYELYLLARDA